MPSVCWMGFVEEVRLCTVTVGHQSLAQLQERSCFVVAVGIGAVLQGAGQGGFTVIDLYGNHTEHECCLSS